MLSSVTKKRSLALIILLLVIFSVLAAISISPISAATWNITGSTFSHDPSIIKANNTWWQFYTADGIGLKTSSNGTSWTQCSSVLKSKLSWWSKYVPSKTDFNIWAPDIFYHNGRYWLYYSVSTFGSNTSAIGLLSCENITNGGTWRDDGIVIKSTSSNNYNCIDPCLTQDASGNLWLSFGSFWTGIKLIQVDKSTMKPISGAQIYSIASRSDSSAGIEAPYIIYNNGYYYLFVSFDKCCSGTNSTYKIAYGRSTNITGPYTDKNNNRMTNGGGTILDQSNGQWIGPGGQSVAKDGSNYMMVHHAYNAYANGEATLRIKDLYFDSNNWPTYTYTYSQPSTATQQTSTNIIKTATPQTILPSSSAPQTIIPSSTPNTNNIVPSSSNYSVNYSKNDWGAGSTTTVKITNNSSTPKTGWKTSWTFPGDQTITSLWSGTYNQTGKIVTVTNGIWNETIPAGGSVSFGFNLSYSGSNNDPTDFTIN